MNPQHHASQSDFDLEQAKLMKATNSTLSINQRRAFMKLSLEERRQLLAQQAQAMQQHYQQDEQWRQLETGDFCDY
ncbi:hypothetical protein H6G17_08950 [Chroococcidiopsis sp. FACHB-1243]|uniref:hypothetical protein n=1 Tax=Chroococcidiopsis sp. [FACHB-1243] TaxID=2692781 RepID=UPI0017834785|nr:hypothetical protein [Chroococcidiopsis sp. [FACHB-1243]]MBD2305644.1 hypothetical protein [Chroococcidiopsis sp. [FACHB-1243]]